MKIFFFSVYYYIFAVYADLYRYIFEKRINMMYNHSIPFSRPRIIKEANRLYEINRILRKTESIIEYEILMYRIKNS